MHLNIFKGKKCSCKSFHLIFNLPFIDPTCAQQHTLLTQHGDPPLKDMGLSIVNILRRSGLPDDLLNRPAVRLHADDFHLFWKSIGEESNDPLLPLILIRSIQSETFSPPLFAALCSPDLHIANERISR